jgi:hypothetical protein
MSRERSSVLLPPLRNTSAAVHETSDIHIRRQQLMIERLLGFRLIECETMGTRVRPPCDIDGGGASLTRERRIGIAIDCRTWWPSAKSEVSESVL